MNDEGRNRRIVHQVVTTKGPAGECAAVITRRIDHAEALGAALVAEGQRVAVLSSRVSKKSRAAALDRARAGEVDVIVATQLFDEGVDIQNLSRVHLVFPARAEGRIVQRCGRALRVIEGKSVPVIFDYVDPLVGVLHHQARLRRRLFKRTWPAQVRSAA